MSCVWWQGAWQLGHAFGMWVGVGCACVSGLVSHTALALEGFILLEQKLALVVSIVDRQPRYLSLGT